MPQVHMLNFSFIKAITLDLDDTLWPTDPVIDKAEAALKDWFRVNAPATFALWKKEGIAKAARHKVQSLHPDKLHDLSFLRRETIRAVMQEAGDFHEMADAAFAVFYTARQQVELFDDVHMALKNLAGKYPLHTLTNGNADIVQIGISHFFQSTISARSVGVAKPDMRIFQIATEKLNLAFHEILHVGDDPELDVDAARNVGMQAVWINRKKVPWPRTSPEPVQVHDLNELVQLLQQKKKNASRQAFAIAMPKSI